MKAVILVGGKATRLEPLTINTPKAMLPVLNTPFLEHVIRHLAGHEVKDIVLAQGHLAQPIEDHLGDGRRFGVRLIYVVEDTPRGTAGAIKNAEQYLDDTFLVLNGDIFTDLDITTMIEFHRGKKAMATIALTPVEDPTAYGLVETDADSRISRFLEKPNQDEITTNMINAGTYVLETDVLAQIQPNKAVSIERETFPQLLARGEPVYAYSSPAYWIDTGTPEKYLQLHRDLLNGRSRGYTLVPGKEALIGEGCEIHPAARIEGPAVIGDNCAIGQNVRLSGLVAIGDGCIIQENCVIEDSVIWRNAIFAPGVHINNSVIADNCRLSEGSRCDGAVLGDNITLARDVVIEPGRRIEPGTNVE